jgi:hypothetical protein
MSITKRSFGGRPEVRSDASSGMTDPMGDPETGLPGNPASPADDPNGDENDILIRQLTGRPFAAPSSLTPGGGGLGRTGG